MIELRRQVTFVFFSLVLASLFIVSAQARGGTFNIAPTQEATDTVKLWVSDSIVGNVSVYDGLIDFRISNPYGVTVLCCNQTSFESFNLTAEEEGVYVIHLVNNYETENVTVLLSYGANFNVVLRPNLNIGMSTGVATVVAVPTPPVPFDWLEFFSVIARYVEIGVLGVLALWGRWKDRNWKKKYEKVVVTRPSPLQGVETTDQ